MVRNAKALMTILAIAPGIYIALSIVFVLLGGGGFLSSNPGKFLSFFLALFGVSVVDIAALVFLQTNKRVMASMARYDPAARVFHIGTLGSILSDAPSVFGLILTLLSGSLAYIAGFSITSWICIFWVRSKFEQNLATLPDK